MSRARSRFSRLLMGIRLRIDFSHLHRGCFIFYPLTFTSPLVCPSHHSSYLLPSCFFTQPPPTNQQPTAFLSHHTDSISSNSQAKIKLAHGTTTLAFRFRGGIIVSVDSRASAGSYIGEFSRSWCIVSGFEGLEEVLWDGLWLDLVGQS